jgi:4-amino-4-deoxy-L-arabinose transferase-like glycosyltransferase
VNRSRFLAAIRAGAARALRGVSAWLERLAVSLEAGPPVQAEEPPAGFLGMILWSLSLVVFLVSRLVGLQDFPIYFFCDEAVNSVRAADFVRNGFRDSFGQFFPTYFQNGGFFNLSASVYAQILPRILFGPSVFVTRATAVLFALAGVVAVGLILKRIFRLRFPWLGMLLLAVTPAWFLHSRTAFETTMAASFYAWFLYFYLRYRSGHRSSLFACILFGALAFYTYSPMQLVVIVTGLLLLLSDFAYHWENRRTAARGLLLIVLLALPYGRALFTHPQDTEHHLRQAFSYWVSPELTAAQKLVRYGEEYAHGLSPRFWFAPENPPDLVRHRMKGYGNLLWLSFPFAAGGLFLSLARFRSVPYRVVLVAVLAAPAGGALVRVSITRALVFVVPAALMTAIGLEAALTPLVRRLGEAAVSVSIFVLLTAVQLWMLLDALANGATWYRDYGLNGMQYGARQVFGEVGRYLRQDPQSHMVVSPVWANGTDELQRFFLPDEPRVALHDLRWYAEQKRVLAEDTVLILTRDEFGRIVSDPKFVLTRTESVLRYPDGSEAFYFVRFRYAADFEARRSAEREKRHALVREEVLLQGETVEVAHSHLDTGRVALLFDGDAKTLVRTAEVNPAVVQITFSALRELDGITVTTGAMDLCLTARLYGKERGRPSVYAAEFVGLPGEPTVHLPFDPPVTGVKRIRIEIQNIRSGDRDNVHVREIQLK